MNYEIISKIQNLLNLSKNNINLNESAAAYKAAQKLLTRHKLTLADIQLKESKHSNEPIEISDIPLYTGKRAITWKGCLADRIATANGCGVWWSKQWNNGWVNHLKIMGTASDIAICTWLFNNCVFQIENMCKVALAANPGGGKTFSNNFKIGAVDAIAERLTEAKQEVEKEYEGTAAMVLVKKNEIEVSKAMNSMNLKPKKASYRSDYSGYAAGKKAGKKVDLSKYKMNSTTKGLLK